MAVTTGGRWTDDGGIASGRFTSFLGGSGGVVAWSIAGAGLANQLNSSSLPNFTTTEDLGTFLPPGYEQILREAFDLWAAVADIEFIQVADSGYAFGSVSYPTIRIGGGYIDGGAYGSTWGYAFYPSSWGPGGDIVFDSSNTALSETDFRWLALHEIGHAIGLDHTTIQPAVM
ncbi:MAG: matrixin family metalloprotease, partial [Planctomycetaceae bacterium]